ncbi:PAS domain-containing sensor histidine kinase [Serpentinimonas barnesii]|uniref:PAS domain-containing sensor histidine kinase n=1 Tax=Serpentinimonas barnesii TaxID=1458427 RepID=UPI0014944D00|nr:ATP-binding protein [Serpentinimonas barnesii]
MIPAAFEDKLPPSFFTSLYDELGLERAVDAPPAEPAALPGPAAPPHPATDPGSGAHWQLLAESLRDAAIFFLDAEGRVCDWTPSAERLLGFGAAQMLGQSVDRFTPVRHPASAAAKPADTATGTAPEPSAAPDPGTPDPLSLGLERAALLGQSETPGWQRRADGSLLWAHTVLTALYDPDSGQAHGYACLMRDTTETQRLLELLEHLNTQLEARVQERTRQLLEINHDLEAFTASVSHDLRAPLRHIGSYLELLREDLGPELGPEVQRHLETIGGAAEHMGQLIDGLLAFSRLGRAALQRQPVAMGDLLRSSQNRVQHDPALQRPSASLRWQLPPELPQVRCDARLLSQVWDNLLSNALKYSRPRPVAEICVGWRPQRSPNGTPETVFWVQDNGVGFDPQRAERLFGVFQRLHRARDFEGVGIGLALCRRIVERHGGRIWAEGAPDQGSTFYFSLPDTDAAAPAA